MRYLPLLIALVLSAMFGATIIAPRVPTMTLAAPDEAIRLRGPYPYQDIDDRNISDDKLWSVWLIAGCDCSRSPYYSLRNSDKSVARLWIFQTIHELPVRSDRKEQPNDRFLVDERCQLVNSVDWTPNPRHTFAMLREVSK